MLRGKCPLLLLLLLLPRSPLVTVSETFLPVEEVRLLSGRDQDLPRLPLRQDPMVAPIVPLPPPLPLPRHALLFSSFLSKLVEAVEASVSPSVKVFVVSVVTMVRVKLTVLPSLLGSVPHRVRVKSE